MSAMDDDTQTLLGAAVERMLEAEQSHKVRTHEVGDEWAAVLALRATTLSEYICAINLTVAEHRHQSAVRLREDAARRRPSGRRVHTVAKSQELQDVAARHLEQALAAELAALAAIGVSDIAEATRAVAHVLRAESANQLGSADDEWGFALDLAKSLRARRTKLRRWNYVRGRAQQAPQPHDGLLPLSYFNRHELGGEPLSRKTETGPAGTIASAVELLARWDIAGEPHSETKPITAALEAIRAVRRGEHTEAGPGRVASMMRRYSWNEDILDELDWLDDEDNETLIHIAEMRNRVFRCFEQFGQPLIPGNWAIHSERFHIAGYIDFVTADTIWDLKVSTTAPRRVDVLQLLLYWIAFADEHADGYEITHLGLCNPRLDIVWRIAVQKIPADVVSAIESLALSTPP